TKKKKMDQKESVRLNKAISDSGYCSRREADVLIEKGRVTLNAKQAVLGDRVYPEDEIKIDGKPIKENTNEVYIILNKPVGITCTTDTRFEGNVIDFINHPERIFPVGRLDKPSEGLLLLTNDGNIVNKILRAGNAHEKEYIVKVNRPITDDFIKRMGAGVPILNTVTKRCKVEQISRFEFRIILIQGLNRQIRRMCEYLDYEVVELKRIRLMNLTLDNLAVGEWRNLTLKELQILKDSVKDSDGRPTAPKALKQTINKKTLPIERSGDKRDYSSGKMRRRRGK